MMNCLLTENESLQKKIKLIEKDKDMCYKTILEQKEEIDYLNNKLVIESKWDIYFLSIYT